MCCKIWIKRELYSCYEIYSKLDFISQNMCMTRYSFPIFRSAAPGRKKSTPTGS